MKTTQLATTPVVNTQPQLVPNVLIECMAQLKSVRAKIDNYYKASEHIRDCIRSNYDEIDSGLNNVAAEIAQMMSTEMLESTFYAKEESEVCDA